MGMPKIELRLQMFRGDWDQIWSQMRLLWMMEGLARVNQTHLRQFDAFKARGLIEKTYPPLYRSGLHYETEKGTEIWPDYPSLLSGTMGRGKYPGHWGDCEDLACVRTAEYRTLPWHYARLAPWDKLKVERADPRFPQSAEPVASGLEPEAPGWSGWKKVKGGIKAKPFAKWRRGPKGNYHYHALTLLPDGRLEDPSLVLGMGKEAEFHAAGTAEKFKAGASVAIEYAKAPDVMVVDPEKPSGYAGGIARKLDDRLIKELQAGRAPEGAFAALGDPEIGAYLSNEIPLDEDEFDVDGIIGWNRTTRRFETRSDASEARRLFGYARH